MTNYKTEWFRANGKRYLTWFALAIAFSIACWNLSQWQLSRLEEVRAANSLITENYSQPPVELDQLASPDSFDAKNEYRQVKVTGTYLKDSLLIRNRPQNGQPGFDQFAGFVTTDNQLLFIDRGWYPTGQNQDLPDVVQELRPNCEPITIIGHLRSAQPNSNRAYPKGQIGNASPEEALANASEHFAHGHSNCNQSLDLTVFKSIYLTLEAETPALTTANPPKFNQKPELSERNHLSYAMQWVLFAIMAFIALFYMIRQELLIKREQTDKNFKRKVRKTRSQADADYEDQLTERN